MESKESENRNPVQEIPNTEQNETIEGTTKTAAEFQQNYGTQWPNQVMPSLCIPNHPFYPMGGYGNQEMANYWHQMIFYPFMFGNANPTQSVDAIQSTPKPPEPEVPETDTTEDLPVVDMDQLPLLSRMYTCRVCNRMKNCTNLEVFRTHIEEHLGRRVGNQPFHCLHCQKAFRYRSNCRNHMIAHFVVRKSRWITEITRRRIFR